MIDVMLIAFMIIMKVNQPKPPEESESSHFLLLWIKFCYKNFFKNINFD